jgi:hypothetical protein
MLTLILFAALSGHAPEQEQHESWDILVAQLTQPKQPLSKALAPPAAPDGVATRLDVLEAKAANMADALSILVDEIGKMRLVKSNPDGKVAALETIVGDLARELEKLKAVKTTPGTDAKPGQNGRDGKDTTSNKDGVNDNPGKGGVPEKGDEKGITLSPTVANAIVIGGGAVVVLVVLGFIIVRLRRAPAAPKPGPKQPSTPLDAQLRAAIDGLEAAKARVAASEDDVRAKLLAAQRQTELTAATLKREIARMPPPAPVTVA